MFWSMIRTLQIASKAHYMSCAPVVLLDTIVSYWNFLVINLPTCLVVILRDADMIPLYSHIGLHVNECGCID